VSLEVVRTDSTGKPRKGRYLRAVAITRQSECEMKNCSAAIGEAALGAFGIGPPEVHAAVEIAR
jgi:hypothetical protein